MVVTVHSHSQPQPGRRSQPVSCSPLLVTVTEPVPETVRLELSGDLDLTAEPLLRDLSAALVRSDPDAVELDIGGLAFVDLRGLRSLGALWTSLQRRAAVTLTRTSRAFDRLLAACAHVGAQAALPLAWAPAVR
jgi:anti-anti-sigma regulatory factor